MRSLRRQRGVSFIEVMATVMIIMILASAIVPLSRTVNKRRKEVELQRALRQIRTALDLYSVWCNPNPAIATPDWKVPPRKLATEYQCNDQPGPASLDDLVRGLPLMGDVTGTKLKFLRHIPIDPMTNAADWVTRCYSQEAGDKSPCPTGRIWDVHSKSEAVSLDGKSKYNEW